MWQVGPIISRLTQGLLTLSWPPAWEPSPPKPVPFWVLQGKQVQKDSPEYFVAGMYRYFPTSFWGSLSVLLPFWEEMFPCLWNLVAKLAAKLAAKSCPQTFSWEHTNYFYQPPSKTTPEWKRPFMDVWSKDSQISSNADGKSRPDYIPLWDS